MRKIMLGAAILVSMLMGVALAAKPVDDPVVVVVTPNPVAAGENYSLSGCGFEMQPVEVFRDGVFAYAIGVRLAGGGCLDGNYVAAPGSSGEYLLELWQRREHGNKRDMVASVTLVVE